MQVFGACLSARGRWLLIGSPRDSGKGERAGAAYLYRRVPGESRWVFHQKLEVSGAKAGDHFGNAVALGDGYLVLASRVADTRVGPQTGSAAVFENRGHRWSQTQLLVPSDLGYQARFGRSLALFGDTILIGAPYAEKHPNEEPGRAYFFLR